MQSAIDSFKDTRAFYKNGIKSGNKRYEKETGAKEITRNTNQEIADTFIGRNRAIASKLSPGNSGRYLYINNITAGNCGEMACVAMYLAHTKYHVPKDKIELWTTTSSRNINSLTFQHSLAMLKQDGGKTWVVDPWASICCELGSYEDRFVSKMKEWLKDGKRLPVPGLVFGMYWAEPTESIVLNLVGQDAKWGCVTYDFVPT